MQWLNVSAPGCNPAIPGSSRASPQSTTSCQSLIGLPPQMIIRHRLASGGRQKKYKKDFGTTKKYQREKEGVVFSDYDRGGYMYIVKKETCG